MSVSKDSGEIEHTVVVLWHVCWFSSLIQFTPKFFIMIHNTYNGIVYKIANFYYAFQDKKMNITDEKFINMRSA